MIFKLAFRNMKKSMSDYAVYFVTLIIGVSVFYVFNAISDQTVVTQIFKSEYDIIDLMRTTLSTASVIVSVVLAFLIVYASSYLMKRRKKEFGIYAPWHGKEKNSGSPYGGDCDYRSIFTADRNGSGDHFVTGNEFAGSETL